MTSLHRVQELFCSAVFEPDNGASLEEFRRCIAPRPGLSADDHIKIYRQGVLAKLVEALAEIYPVCRKLVGEAFFHAMARTFVQQIPSLSPDLGEYGHGFGTFIEGFEPAGALPYLADVARLEWLWHRVYHAEPSTLLDSDSLARVPAERQGEIRFRPAAATALLESIYPIHRIWQANQPEHDDDGCVALDEGGVRLLIWRRGYDMCMDPLDEGSWCVLKSFRDGRDFATACESLKAQVPNGDMAGILPALVQKGWIASFTL